MFDRSITILNVSSCEETIERKELGMKGIIDCLVTCELELK